MKEIFITENYNRLFSHINVEQDNGTGNYWIFLRQGLSFEYAKDDFI